jgi:hypothetical protein
MSPAISRGLLNKVWFDVQLHFDRRGSEGNRKLKPDSFVIKEYENGSRYAIMSFNEETNDHKKIIGKTQGIITAACMRTQGTSSTPWRRWKNISLNSPNIPQLFIYTPDESLLMMTTCGIP